MTKPMICMRASYWAFYIWIPQIKPYNTSFLKYIWTQMLILEAAIWSWIQRG